MWSHVGRAPGCPSLGVWETFKKGLLSLIPGTLGRSLGESYWKVMLNVDPQLSFKMTFQGVNEGLIIYTKAGGDLPLESRKTTTCVRCVHEERMIL